MFHLLFEHRVPHDTFLENTSCIGHVVLPKVSNQRNNNLPLWKHLAKTTTKYAEVNFQKALMRTK